MDDIKIVNSNQQSAIEQKRCPNCGSGDVELNPITGKLRCNYCKHEYEPKQVEGFVKNIDELQGTVIGAGAQNIQQMNNAIITCKCSGCGAEITLNANEIAFTKCHWCHTGLALNQQVPSGVVPDAILPFKVSKEEAFEELKKAVDKHKLLADRKFLEEFSIDNLKGVYLPYLTVDVNGHAIFKGRGQKVTKIRNEDDPDGASYDVDIFNVEREFDIQIENLAQSSDSRQINFKKVNNAERAEHIINTLMPYDIENCVAWDANYLKGYSMEHRDINIGDISDNMGLKAKDIARYKANKDCDYDGGINWKEQSIEIYGQQWKSVYLPVWIYSYTQQGYTYVLAMNARTKEMNYIIPIAIPRLLIGTLISIIMPLLGVFFLGMLMKYNHFDIRNRHESDTKSEINNVNRKDEFIKHKKWQNSAYIKGDNHQKVEGE